MAKKNIIWFSVIIVIIIVGYIWLSESVEWKSNMVAVEENTIPVVNSQNIESNHVGNLSITALIPPSEMFNRMIDTLKEDVSTEVNVNYIDREDFTFSTYQTYLLTEDSSDIHLIPNEWILPLAVQGHLKPLDRVLTSEYIEEQNIALIESMKWNSNLWAAPYLIDPYIVVPHQSLAQYFEQIELVNNNIEDATEQVDLNTDELLDITDAQLQADETVLTVWKVLNLLLSGSSIESPIINSVSNHASHIFHFINYVEQDGVHNGQILTENQQALLNQLMEPGYVIEKSIAELVEQEQAALPFFLVLSWSELSKYNDFLEQHYDLSRLQVPIYWSNGYSFVIRHHTNHHELSGQWLEALNRKMKELDITSVGMPLHRHNGLNEQWEQQVALQYNYAFQASSLMTISKEWPIFLEKLNSKWQEELKLTEKLAYWLSQAAIEPTNE